MAIHWQIPFKSLRAGTDYTVNIYDANYSGDAIPLRGGAEPFVTSEDDDEDAFTPMRTQSGTLRIFDNGKDANGATFDWKDLVPTTDTDRPVTLTDGNDNVVWMGTMQAQNFSGTLYGNPQEREYPVQCSLTVLSAYPAPTNETALQNFAYLIRYMMQSVPTECQVSHYYFQGGADARSWLLTRFDWQNFTNQTETGVESRYHLDSVMEDVCRFWGWTVRLHGDSVYFCCPDDLTEQNWLSLDTTAMDDLAGGSTTAGDVITSATATLNGTIFTSTQQDDYKQRGPHKVTVKADVNNEDTILTFAPKSVEDTMDAGGYTWVQGDGDRVGYFTTPEITSFTSATLDGQAIQSGGTYLGGFCRRQIYSDAKTEDSDTFDIINIKKTFTLGDTQEAIRLQSKRAMSYSNGSLRLSGTMYLGSQKYNETEEYPAVYMRLGIGMTRDTAKWWYMEDLINYVGPLQFGWNTTKNIFAAPCTSGTLKSTRAVKTVLDYVVYAEFESDYIPTEEGAFGYLFIEFLGMKAFTTGASLPEFQIAEFSVEYTRDTAYIPTDWLILHPRVMKKKRTETAEYTASNGSQVQDEANIDCIFASDNNLEYGYGLLMDSQSRYLDKVPYGVTTDHPEQHLANRIAAYWGESKRRMSLELRQENLVIAAITPRYYVTVDGTRCHPASISHNWRDDEVMITFLETPSSY